MARPVPIDQAAGAPEISVVVTVFNEAGVARGALPPRDRRARRPRLRADLRRRRLERRLVRPRRAAPRRRRARARREAEAELRPAPGDARRPRPRARRDRRDDGQRPPEPARGPAEADRRGRVGLRRRERPAHRPARLVGPHAAVADDQRDAPPLHRRGHLRLRLRVQRLPARGGRAGARCDRQAEVHEGARPLDRRERRRGRRRPRGAGRQVALLAAPARPHRAAACSPASGRSRSSGSAWHSA